ncbi:unnamed protein product [Victoria cruziana]
MRRGESLLLLCTKTVITRLINGDYDCTNIFALPPELFDFLVSHLPPLALEKLHKVLNATLRSRECDGWLDVEEECSMSTHKRPSPGGANNDCIEEAPSLDIPGGLQQNGAFLLHEEILNHRKNVFNEAWRALFKSRWHDGFKQITTPSEDGEARHVCKKHSEDWQQMYWETHLQNCLDEVAAVAVLPTFHGKIGDVKIPDAILGHIGCGNGKDTSGYHYSKLSYHCLEFGCYARFLKLQNVFCTAEICVLLRNGKLHQLIFRGIKSKNHVDGICKILNQNKKTLISLEFIHCRLSVDVLNDICGSLYTELAHGLMCLSIKSSVILFDQNRDCPTGFLFFLASRRSFHSLDVSDSGLGPTFARMILDILIGSSSNISALEFSDNRISGWLAPHAAAGSSPVWSNLGNCLRSLLVLNLRGNGLGKEDAEDLKSTFIYMPRLKHLDISDNPLEDDGIRALVSYFTEHPEFSVDYINMENCGISGAGVAGILDGLTVLGRPFRYLSFAHNNLGQSIAVPLSNFLSKCHVQRLNIEATGLGPSGFNYLDEAMPSGLALEYLNISKNRGGLSSALFLSKLLRSSELVEVDAGYNFMPLESVSIIHSALKASKGKLKRVDLTGNMYLFKSPLISLFDEFRYEEPIVVLSSSLTSMTPHDDDP